MITRQVKAQLRRQLGCTTEATLRERLRALTPEQYEAEVARARAAL